MKLTLNNFWNTEINLTFLSSFEHLKVTDSINLRTWVLRHHTNLYGVVVLKIFVNFELDIQEPLQSRDSYKVLIFKLPQ